MRYVLLVLGIISFSVSAQNNNGEVVSDSNATPIFMEKTNEFRTRFYRNDKNGISEINLEIDNDLFPKEHYGNEGAIILDYFNEIPDTKIINKDTIYSKNGCEKFIFHKEQLIEVHDQICRFYKDEPPAKVFAYQISSDIEQTNAGGIQINPTLSKIFEIVFSATHSVKKENLSISKKKNFYFVEYVFPKNQGNIKKMCFKLNSMIPEKKEFNQPFELSDMLTLIIDEVFYELRIIRE